VRLAATRRRPGAWWAATGYAERIADAARHRSARVGATAAPVRALAAVRRGHAGRAASLARGATAPYRRRTRSGRLARLLALPHRPAMNLAVLTETADRERRVAHSPRTP
jgi:hypothetical protein